MEILVNSLLKPARCDDCTNGNCILTESWRCGEVINVVLQSVQSAHKLLRGTKRDSLLSIHLMSPTWSNPYSYSNFCGIKYLRTWRRVLLSWVLLSRGFWRSKKSLPKISGQHRQNVKPGQTLRQSGSNPESTFTIKPGPVQSACYSRGLWRIISAMQHTSEHNTCSVETCLYTLLCCMNVHNRMLSATSYHF